MLICNISLINRDGKELLNRFLEEKDLNWRDLVSILVIDFSNSATQTFLRPFLQTDKGNITKILNNLEKKKIIYREENTSDRREKNIYLTDEGKKLVPWLKNKMTEWEKSVYNGLSNDEIENFKMLTEKIIVNLNKEIK